MKEISALNKSYLCHPCMTSPQLALLHSAQDTLIELPDTTMHNSLVSV